MNEGTWTIEPCERDAVATLARELSLSPTTAAVLVRRGYEDVAGARGFLEGALPAHGPFGLGDMAAATSALAVIPQSPVRTRPRPSTAGSRRAPKSRRP